MMPANNKDDPSKNGDDEWNFSSGGDDYYFNNEGYVVFTSKYLLERGYCCGNGCKNCPYDYKAVPEPKRSRLLEQRQKDNANE